MVPGCAAESELCQCVAISSDHCCVYCVNINQRLHRGGGREYDRGPPRRGGYGAQQREGRPPPGMFKDPRRDRGGMPRFGVRRETMLNGTYNDYMKELSYRGPSSIESRSYGHMGGPYGNSYMDQMGAPPFDRPPYDRPFPSEFMPRRPEKRAFERSVDDFLRRTKASRGMSRSSDRRYRDRR